MGSDWGLPCSKENKAFFLQKLYQNFTKFSKFSLEEMLTLKWHFVIHEGSNWGEWDQTGREWGRTGREHGRIGGEQGRIGGNGVGLRGNGVGLGGNEVRLGGRERGRTRWLVNFPSFTLFC